MFLKYFLFLFFMLLSFGWLLYSHDYESYFNHFNVYKNSLELNQISIYPFFVATLYLILNSPEDFVYILWILNWISVFYFIIHKNNFNNWFLLNYLILFSYLWHSNQLRQGLIVPAILHIYFNRKVISNFKKIIFGIILSSWHLASVIVFSFLKDLINYNRKIFFLLPFFICFSLIIGGRISLFNITSLLVLICLYFSYKINLSSFNLPLSFFIFFLLFRSLDDGVFGSRMLELSCLVLPLLLIKKRKTSFRLVISSFSVIIVINNFLFP